jgi:reactive intermediate/imine deaminase
LFFGATRRQIEARARAGLLIKLVPSRSTPLHIMPNTPVSTSAAPAAIGTYSQAIKAGNTCYLSGQIALDPATGQLVSGGFEAEVARVFENLKAVATACGGSLGDAVKITIFLTDLANFAKVNEAMARYFTEPFPARAAVGVASLPRGAQVEADAVLVIG